MCTTGFLLQIPFRYKLAHQMFSEIAKIHRTPLYLDKYINLYHSNANLWLATLFSFRKYSLTKYSLRQFYQNTLFSCTSVQYCCPNCVRFISRQCQTIRKHVYLLLLLFFFSRAIHGLIFRVLWLDSIVGGSNLSKYTAWRSQLGWIAKI